MRNKENLGEKHLSKLKNYRDTYSKMSSAAFMLGTVIFVFSLLFLRNEGNTDLQYRFMREVIANYGENNNIMVIDELNASINHGYDLMQDLNHECADRMRTRLSVLNEMRDVLQIRLEDKLVKQASILSYLDSFHSLESQIESLWKMVDENTDKENLDVAEIQKAYDKVMAILTPVSV